MRPGTIAEQALYCSVQVTVSASNAAAGRKLATTIITREDVGRVPRVKRAWIVEFSLLLEDNENTSLRRDNSAKKWAFLRSVVDYHRSSDGWDYCHIC